MSLRGLIESCCGKHLVKDASGVDGVRRFTEITRKACDVHTKVNCCFCSQARVTIDTVC